MRQVATALAFALSMGVVAADAPQPADLIVTGGRVHTQDPAQPEAEAVAVRDGRFVFVGSAREAAAFRGPKTRVLDVAGATVFPGFIDAHAHLAWFGAHLDLVDLSGAASFDEVVTRVAERAARTPRGAWVLGRSWDQSEWPGKAFPSHAALSRAVPEHPVLLMRVDLHSVIVNQAALRLAGITRATPDPPGGRILRDAQGEPTGVLVDAAVDLVQARVPPTTKAEARAQILAAQRELHRVGLTGIHDAGVPGPVIELLEEMARARELTLRDYVMVRGPGSVVPPGLGSETAEERPKHLAADVACVLAAGPRRNIDGDNRLSVAAIKLAADGAMGSRGAAFLSPYDDDPGNSGYLLLSREQIRDVAVAALRRGVQVAVHAIGDRANRTVLDAFEDALRLVPKSDHRFRIEHASAVHPDDIPRFARLGVIPSVQPSFVPSDGSWVTSRLGAARIGEVYPFRALLDTGVMLPAGNDIPSETPSPLRTFHSALTRGGAENWPGDSGGPKQRLSRDEALKQITVWPAFAAFQEDLVGSVTRGKLADLTILARDILSAPEEQILDTAVVATVVGGQVAYEAPRVVAAAVPVTIGTEHVMHSEVLDEDRKVLVSLPESYEESHQAYPVLFLLDGAAHFHHVTGLVGFLADKGRIPETIVVGVPNTDRTRDLTTPTRDPEPGERNIGGADRFLSFLVSELVPWVEARYRTRPFRILVGHSLGGLFAVKALVDRPDVFPAAIAISPSLWWDRESLTPIAKAGLARPYAGTRRFLYFSSGDNEDWIRTSTKNFAAMLRKAKPAGLDWRYVHMAGEDHGTTPHRTTYAGLEALFAGFEPQAQARAADWPGVVAHFATWSRRLGYALAPPPGMAEWVGQVLIEKKRYAEAEALLRKNLEENPRSAPAMASLAECVEAAGRAGEAERLLEAAVARGTERSDPDLYQYSDALARLRNKRASPVP